MKEAVITPDIQVEIRDVPTPVPKAGEVLVRVVVSGGDYPNGLPGGKLWLSTKRVVADIQSVIFKAGSGPAWYGLDAATSEDGAPEYTGILIEALGTQWGLSGNRPRVATVEGGARVCGLVDGDYINVMLVHTGSYRQ
ncbi:uncharacterized protein CCOS01_15137 [Colletotrichum costaricense]|uniref:Uncharacterized protein n=1 Tax=Colletotrichum costaricense TaxID=1209916 RepID=A0AAJ0DTX0_9PEZI|nr:uncharacterized protein CCOS01_15137 [Colletotrichum costaricense]KAK1511375.1 hypothetical protein CCOS01_15137 [Colletotrichum costaricense]